MDFVHAPGRPLRCSNIVNHSRDELDIVRNVDQPSRMPARIVVQHTHPMACFDQRLYQSGAYEAAATGNQDAAHARISSFAAALATSIHVPLSCERRAASMSSWARYPSAKPGVAVPRSEERRVG